MKIRKYSYHDPDSDLSKGWVFDQVELQDTNILVGDTASGKSRFLNTIFNLGVFISQGERKAGTWNIEFSLGGNCYHYCLEVKHGNKGVFVSKEKLSLNEGKDSRSIIERNDDSIKYNEQLMPKLDRSKSLVTLLKENEDIQPVHEGFTKIMKRNFDAEVLVVNRQHSNVQGLDEKQVKEEKSVSAIFRMDCLLNVKVYYLHKYFPDLFKQFKSLLKECFHFIEDIKVTDLKSLNSPLPQSFNAPTIQIKERHLDQNILFSDLSSGMLKIFILLADILVLPDESLYMVDEYENSLGMSAINFFSTLLGSARRNQQFIFTSHHPYIINTMPVEDWIVFQRKGSHVKSLYGDKLVSYLGKSKQQSFIKLINSPFFSGDDQ